MATSNTEDQVCLAVSARKGSIIVHMSGGGSSTDFRWSAKGHYSQLSFSGMVGRGEGEMSLKCMASVVSYAY